MSNITDDVAVGDGMANHRLGTTLNREDLRPFPELLFLA